MNRKAVQRSVVPDESEPGLDGRLIPASTTQIKRLAVLRGPDRWWKDPLVWAFSYPGRLDVPRLEQALRLVARRHSGLRTYFVPDAPVDVVGCLPPQDAVWPLREMTAGSDPDGASAEAHAWLREFFSPYERPLVRAVVVHRPADDFFGVSIEHSILDHAAALALFEDITHVYNGLVDRPASAFDVLVSDAVKFAASERAWFAGAEAKRTLEWWDERNGGLGAYPGLDLPELGKFEPYGPMINYNLVLSDEDSARLTRYATRLRLTTTMLASAAAAVTLRAHGHSADVRFHFGTSRRIWPGTEKLVGYCSNRMMVRLPVTAQDTVASLAPKVRSEVLTAVGHSMFSHEEYVRARYPDAYTRLPSTYGYLNALVYSPAPELDGRPLARESVPLPKRMYHQPGLALGLFRFTNGRTVVNASCAEGMYEEEFVHRFTHDLARACAGPA